MKSTTIWPPISRSMSWLGNLLGGLDVGPQRHLFEILLAADLAGVDVDSCQGLGVVDDQLPATGQIDVAAENLLQLRFDAETLVEGPLGFGMDLDEGLAAGGR